MAFWGVEVKPGKPYTHNYESENGRLRLSQATLGSGSSTKKSIVQCTVGDKSPIYLCSLLPEKLETCPLNLEFEEEEVTFSVIGPHSVHLSGFFYGEDDEDDEEEDDYTMNPYGEDIAETDSGTDDSVDYDSEDDDEDDFIVDDDLEMYPPSPIPNSGVKIEEIVDDEKPASENGNSKQQKKKKNQLKQSDDNENAERQIVVKTGSAHHVLESEDEDGFPISSPGKSGSSRKSEEKKNEGESEKVLKKKTVNDSEPHKNLKRKIDAVSEDGENSRKSGQQSDSSLQTDGVVSEKNAKKKKNKKKKVAREEEITNDTDGKSDVEEVKDAQMENGQKPSDEKEKKKSKKKNKKQESAPDSNAKQQVTAKKESTKTETKPIQARTWPNGLIVEELAMGKPDGARASRGKKVSVHYIGKLQRNGKIFDSNIGRRPFQFRLGIGQVIKGWDVGVDGMRVGDKRRLVIPPSMGYGAKGAKPAIPPNATLVFDIELAGVN